MPSLRPTERLAFGLGVLTASALLVELSVPSRASAAAPPLDTPTIAMTWGVCGYNTSENKVIRTFERYRAQDGVAFLRGGPTYLACGNENWGYWHTVANHLTDRQSLTFLTGDNWRDLADTPINTILADPDVTKYRSTNNSFCFSREIDLVNNCTRKVASRNCPNVIVGAQNGRIITAYPSKVQCR